MRRAWRTGLAVLLSSVIVGCGWLYLWVLYDLPAVEEFETYIVESGGATRYTPVSLSEIPDQLRWATLAVEDLHFNGCPAEIDPRSLIRGAYYILQNDSYGRDGASITEWLVVNVMTVSEKRVEDLRRQRIRELVLTVWITQRYTKDEILERYLNSVYYGNGVYGAEAAALYYFGKNAEDLGLAECAMLVSLAHMPDSSLPQDLELVEQFRGDVLRMMAWRGYISEEEADLATVEEVSFEQ